MDLEVLLERHFCPF